MANKDFVHGFKPVKSKDGNVQQNTYYCPATENVKLHVGDVVKQLGESDAKGGAQSITKGTAGAAFIGVVTGFSFLKNLTDPSSVAWYRKYKPALTAAYVIVCDDPNQEFECQVSAALAAADVGLNADLTAGTANDTTGFSGMALDAATKATTATLQFKIKHLVDASDNDFGTYNKAVVVPNNHVLKGGTGTTGV